jgi:hypothetical protein
LVHPLHYSFSYPNLLLKNNSKRVSMFHIHTYIESTHQPYSPSFTLFIYPPLPLVPSSLHDLLYLLVLHCLVSVLCSVEILPWYFAYKYIVLKSVYPSPLPFLTTFPLPGIVHQFSVSFVMSYFYTDMMYFIIIHSL